MFDYKLAKAKGNVFENNVYISPEVLMGSNNYFRSNTVINGRCIIGDNNIFDSGCVICAIPRECVQKPDKPKKLTSSPAVVIGSENLFETNVSIQTPLEKQTVIHDHICIGAHSHISHDVEVADWVIISSHCSIAGYCYIDHHANLGMGTVVHQRRAIGAYAMTGAGSFIKKHILPATTAVGVPAHFLSANTLGLSRCGFNAEDIALIDMYLRDECKCDNLPSYIRDIYKNFYLRVTKFDTSLSIPMLKDVSI